MVRSNASPAPYSKEVDKMHTDERIPKLVADVAHLQSDVTEIKVETRALRQDLNKLREDMHTQGKEIRAEMHAGFATLREEMQAQGKELRAEVGGVRDSVVNLTLQIERSNKRQWVALAVLYVLVALSLGGVPTILAHAFKLM